MDDKNPIDIILLAEDNPGDQRLIQRSFKKLNINLVIVEDGEAVLQHLEDNPPPSIVLMDANMAPMDGFEALKIIKQTDKLKTIPIIMLTTSRQNSDIARAYNGGANAYIVKPVTLSKFAEVAKAIQGFWLEFNEVPYE